MKSVNHPWQNGPAELLRSAIAHYSREEESSQRIAFLLFDVATETVFKTYLLLPAEVTGTSVPFADRQKAARGGFHELVRGVERAAVHLLNGHNLNHVQFYHGIRNQLYHEGNGITVPTGRIKEYAEIAVKLFRDLLDMDLTDELREPEVIAKELKKLEETQNELLQQTRVIKVTISHFHEALAQVIENIEPNLVMPSFVREYDSVYFSYDTETVQLEGRMITTDHRIDKLVDLVKSKLRDPNVDPVSLFTVNVASGVTRKKESRIFAMSREDLYIRLLEVKYCFDADGWITSLDMAQLYPEPSLHYIDLGMSDLNLPKKGLINKREDLEKIIAEGKNVELELNEKIHALQNWIYPSAAQRRAVQLTPLARP